MYCASLVARPPWNVVLDIEKLSFVDSESHIKLSCSNTHQASVANISKAVVEAPEWGGYVLL